MEEKREKCCLSNEKKSFCKAVIFDMDGVMFDTERVIQRAWEEAGNRMGYKHFGNHIYHTLGMNQKRRRQYFMETMGSHFPYDIFLEMYREISARDLRENGIPIKQGLLELIGFLKEKNIPMAVATSSSREYAEQKLKETGIFSYLDVVLCGNMVTHSKPDPEIYEKTCKMLKIRAREAIVLEDSENGLKAAIAAGTRVIMVPDLIQDLPEIERQLEAKLKSLHEVKIYMEGLQ